jgi:hypothetical protein
MNRTKTASRRYEVSKPEIDHARNKRRLARRLLNSVDEDNVKKSELMKMATLLSIRGRASMNKDALLEAIRECTK